MKKYLVILVSLVMVVVIFSFNYLENEEIIHNSKNPSKSKNYISMMIETNSSSGIYQESNDSVWPQDGYEFNNVLSKCENGSTLIWDDATRKVVMKGNVSDKCYVYFDVVPTLAAHIKGKYTSQGAGGLYLHNSTLVNGANDGSYRYAGANPNNYVCFGSTIKPCPIDNQYRIIGVFGNQVKLIKSDYANSNLLGIGGNYREDMDSSEVYYTYKGQLNTISLYSWKGSSNNNNWNESILNTINLNKNFLNKFDAATQNKIATTTWKVGGNTEQNIKYQVPSVAYKNEIVNPAESTTYNAKIGLMYVSDYGFATDPSRWTNTVGGKTLNWMHLGMNTWTISCITELSDYSFRINDPGGVDSSHVQAVAAVRPVFYLTSSTTYASGSGTQESPYYLL